MTWTRVRLESWFWWLQTRLDKMTHDLRLDLDLTAIDLGLDSDFASLTCNDSTCLESQTHIVRYQLLSHHRAATRFYSRLRKQLLDQEAVASHVNAHRFCSPAKVSPWLNFRRQQQPLLKTPGPFTPLRWTRQRAGYQGGCRAAVCKHCQTCNAWSEVCETKLRPSVLLAVIYIILDRYLYMILYYIL